VTDDRLHDLATRYYDGALTDAELAELSAAVRDSADARQALADLAVLAVGLSGPVATGPRPARSRRWFRLGWAAGLAAAVGLVAAGTWWAARTDPETAVGYVAEIERTVGQVVSGPGLRPLTAGAPVLPGQVVRTVGVGSGVTLRCRDGSRLFLAGDTAVSVTEDGGPRVAVARGDLAADVADRPDRPFQLTTPEARVAARAARMLVTCGEGETRVGVVEGQARLSGPDGGPPLAVDCGERGVVGAGGPARKERSPPTPDEYAWHTDRPLPPRWELGRLADGPGGPAIAPLVWDDPYNRRTCWQVRSENGWTRGLFHIHQDTKFRVRYRVDRPGEGQLLVVVRPDPPMAGKSFVLLAPVPFEPAPGGWRTVELTADDWVPETLAPDMPHPWVAFLVVFNTYEADLGLRVAGFDVRRPAAGPVPMK
jgi:ferric-dicitrate binding protein FerR (iron transport regulator)